MNAKLKTHSGAKKRFKLTKNGKVKRAKAFKSHILNSQRKDTKRKRNLRKGAYAPGSMPKNSRASLGITI